MPERHRLLLGMIAWVGFRRTFVDFDAPRRVAGTTKYRWRKRLARAVDGVLGFSMAPIRQTIQAGFVVVALGGLYLAYVLGREMWTGEVVTGRFLGARARARSSARCGACSTSRRRS